MVRGFQRVGLFEIGIFEEESAHFRHEEHDGAEDEQEHAYRLQVVHRVVRVESHTIQRDAVRALLLLDFNAVGVVGAHFVQGQQVQYHQRQQHDGQGHDMQCEEAVQGHPGNQVITADPGHQILAHHRNGTEQGDDHLRPPVGHLAPGQHIADEGFRHQHHENEHAEDPDQLARLLVGAVDQGAEHVQIHDHKERRGASRVHVAQHPAVIDIAHDVLDRGKGLLRAGGVVHGQPDAGQQLIDQHQQGQHTEVIPEIEVLGRVVLAHVGIPGAHDWQPLVHPVTQSNKHIDHQAASASMPITMTFSLS